MYKKPIPYLYLDDETGQPMLMNEKCTIFFSETISILRESLYRVIGEGSELVLRVIGRDMGKKYAQLVMKQFPELEDVSKTTQIHELCSIILRNTGFGKIKILELDLKKPLFKAVIKDAPSCLTFSSRPTTYNLEAGMLSGILGRILDVEMAVAECEYNKEEDNYEVTLRRVAE
ncbi:MAG TPA: hypothetical protein ENH28_02395 [Euryarchaeota archaeon]|nr:hypothetical protein BMS3Bbin15_01986 [archaeon BMS3Bbin15]HDL14997.1 hypothetical protein [Euryarchaeota archaeon]